MMRRMSHRCGALAGARRAKHIAVLVVLTSLTLGGGGAVAEAQPLASFSASTSTQQAGAHPNLDVSITPATGTYLDSFDFPTPTAVPYPLEQSDSYVVNLPPGLLGNPTAFPTCSDSALFDAPQSCPIGSDVGVFTLQDPLSSDPGASATLPVAPSESPVYLLPPNPGQVARLGIPINGGVVVVHVDITVRDTTDFGLTATVTNLPSAEPFVGADLQLWGVPSASTHDQEREGCYNGGAYFYYQAGQPCSQSETGTAPFLINPTSCSGPQQATLAATFYGDPNSYNATSMLPATTGCASLPFSPSLSLSSASGQVGQPDAFNVGLSVPQPDADDPVATDTTAAVNDVSVTLPQGVALSPGVAGGLGACTDAQFGQGSDAAVACPDNSSIGTVTVNTPLLSGLLTGSLYVGQQESSDPTSGQMYRIFLNAVGQGVDLKLIGAVSANPSTGQLTARFPQNPQVPFSSLKLSFDGGPQAPLANPETCGTATSSWSISSYANPSSPVTGSSSFPVSGNCALSSQFSPSLSAGTVSNRAGASSPFSFTLTRPDGQEWMSGIPNVSLPTGLLANIGSVPLCSSSSAAAANCPASSQVGAASIAAGAGSEPFDLTNQPVYLTGPYEGAPFGLVEEISGIAGPFDLGTTIERQAIYVNPTTAQVTLHSDALPTMLGGVPLDLQSISIDLNRPGFMQSPTSCAAKSISADVQGSTPGQAANVAAGYVGYAPSVASTVHLTQPFQMGDCGALLFSPKLALTASGKGQTRTNSHPTITAKLTQPAGEANLSAVKVALPLSLALDPNNSEHVCSVAAAAKIACPAKTIVGTASAITRILPHPLSGKVYLVQGERKGPHGTMIKTTPALLVPLDGTDGVAIDLHAQTTVNSAEQLVTTFQGIPDAGIKSFDLKINGGRKGILVVTGNRNLCRGDETATVTENAQSGKVDYGSATLSRPACRVTRSSRKHAGVTKSSRG